MGREGEEREKIRRKKKKRGADNSLWYSTAVFESKG